MCPLVGQEEETSVDLCFVNCDAKTHSIHAS